MSKNLSADPSFRKALINVASKSEEAAEIVRRRYGLEATSSSEPEANYDFDAMIEDIIADTVEPTAENSKALIALARKLLDDIAELKDQIDKSPDADESEDKSHKYEQEFRATLSGKNVSDLKLFYTRSVFEELKPSTRYIVAKALCEYAIEQNKEPSRLWLSLTASAGVIEEI